MHENWTVCGEGTLLHPVTNKPVATKVFEVQGFGTIGEWYDYSNTPEENVRLIAAAPRLLEICKAVLFRGYLTGSGLGECLREIISEVEGK